MQFFLDVVILIIVSLVSLFILSLAFLFLTAWLLRRYRIERTKDPPALRTYASLKGNNPLFFQGGTENDGPVGIGLFQLIRDGLKLKEIDTSQVEVREWKIDGVATLGAKKFLLGLGYIGDDPPQWLATIDDAPIWNVRDFLANAIAREPIAPRDCFESRALLSQLDAVLKALPGVETIRWYRREDWATNQYDKWSATQVLAWQQRSY